MIVVRHRRNTLDELRATDPELGIEVDIRSRGERLIVHHDAFVDGEDFERWLDGYRHRLLILNVKEEGLEARLMALMRERGIEDWFFLDQSFPFLVRTARGGESRCAVRVSEYESLDTALALAGMVRWVWVDCFTRFPLDGAQAARLHAAGFALCLVSPELQGRDAAVAIPALRAQLAAEGIVADAVCTKEPALWR
ncbi:MAG: phosphatidylinositol-specific phospholipase C/glycerophosphodiester phosphodiesterase family protein [Pseudomonadota bacterium]